MRLATVRRADRTHAAVGDDRGWVLFDEADAQELVGTSGWRDRAEAALRHPARIALEMQEFANPVPRPAKVFCCGLNYRDHIVETGRAVPEFPTLFAKFADTLTGAEDDIVVHNTDRLDWEAELAVIVGTEVHRADRVQAQAAILGYAVSNDISMRDWQQRTLQWLQGKAFDATTPVGPWVVTADEIDPNGGLRITCAVNGELVQDADTADLVFDAADLIAYVSQITVLRPGDIVLTGTPGGVALGMPEPRWLRDGDVVTTEIEGIGALRNTIRFDDGP
ncbi:2-keto-4-pentenoate hydratase/2-oxohepta-3-ene-1,7-dioic acid hydratase in catechol pathway [Microbacterium phyllosphaerae]|uniref:2-keto-4-pentenoate hydratase/2-oxohepta-3-ene-1,7-dioic acid hydratase in catechol pathway n=1 Tax=Microbacterium phyllosphaerae TaxID=124798 RepID=A0ABS4WTZ2_9MICO|nr:fumarylacetoacetate hydrolase family protein [Microbacterium phyllosphaerae]MBP2379665.1 2-keto-4-pentenoate hydratase/2-oxohepta-3-ene-1,7-dioic acid hydratase in catechol pathway [Microbacterium phyllosphaerae]